MTLDLGDGFTLRQATVDDHAALLSICLRTGDAGEDATPREDDPDLLGLIFAVPYQKFAPELAFMLEGPNGPCGYVLGALDTEAFNARLRAEWYPELQQRIAASDTDATIARGSDWARTLVRHPVFNVYEALAPFPSHGHIDLMPEARGRGRGRAMMSHLEERLTEMGSPGMHLGVDPRNTRALHFYQRLGFRVLDIPEIADRTIFVAKTLGVSSK